MTAKCEVYILTGPFDILSVYPSSVVHTEICVLIINVKLYIEKNGLDIKKRRSQAYNSVVVISDAYTS